MDFEQSFSGPVDWNFPSPIVTPTHQSFGQNTSQTPRTSSFPSHFQDAFNTPQVRSLATPRQHHLFVTPLQRPHTSAGPRPLNGSVTFPTSSIGHEAAPPVQQSDVIAPYSQWHGDELSDAPQPQQVQHENVDAVQMRTPPPTRGSNSRKSQQHRFIAFGTPSTIASRRIATPQRLAYDKAAHPRPQHTPVQYPALQISEVFDLFANTGPATAPALQSSNSFWDPSSSPFVPRQSVALEDPFSSTCRVDPLWNLEPMQDVAALAAPSFNVPAMHGFAIQPPHPRPATAGSKPRTAATSNAIAAPAAPTSVDPSLLFTAFAQPILQPTSRTSNKCPAASRMYAKQRATHGHTPTDTLASSDSVAKHPAMPLRRSNTTGGTRPSKPTVSATSTNSFAGSAGLRQAPRTASPLKRAGTTAFGSHLGCTGSKSRASVILTVDATGLARTETRPRDDKLDRSMQARYPGLFDSDSSEDENEAAHDHAEQVPSFLITRSEERKQKAARLGAPVERLEGFCTPRSSSSAALSNASVTPSRASVVAAAQLRRQGSARKPTATPHSQTRRNVTSIIDTCPMDMGNDTADWSAVPKDDMEQEVFDGPSSHNASRSSQMQSTLDAHNRHWSLMSSEQKHHVFASQLGSDMPSYSGQYPPAEHGQLPPPSRKMRCVCGIPDEEGQPIIQCVLCTQWLHLTCLNIDAHTPPSGFTCFLCTRPA